MQRLTADRTAFEVPPWDPKRPYSFWHNFWRWVVYACHHPEDPEGVFMATTLGEALHL